MVLSEDTLKLPSFKCRLLVLLKWVALWLKGLTWMHTSISGINYKLHSTLKLFWKTWLLAFCHITQKYFQGLRSQLNYYPATLFSNSMFYVILLSIRCLLVIWKKRGLYFSNLCKCQQNATFALFPSPRSTGQSSTAIKTFRFPFWRISIQ